MKKVFTLIGIVLIISFIILGLWYLFTTKKDSVDDTFVDGVDQVGTFFPDSQNGSQAPLFGTDADNNTITDANFVPQFRQLSQVPVSGMISFERLATSSDATIDEGFKVSTTTETVFRYIERGTGHIFETTERIVTQERISNITIPQIQKAFFNNEGDKLFLQYFANNNETLQTFSGEIVQISTTTSSGAKILDSKIETFFYSSDLNDLTPSYNNKSVFSISKNNNGSTVENTSFVAKITTPVTSSLLSNWIAQSVNSNLLTLTTKANSEIPGYLYFYDISKGLKNRVLGPIDGLTTNTSPSGRFVLYSSINRGKIALSVYDTQTAKNASLAFQTLPEKCIWKSSNESIFYCAVPASLDSKPLPESWYQGLTSFNDELWKVELREDDNPSYAVILEPSRLTGQEFDITNLQLSPKEEYLIFTNKNDLNLWSFDVTSF